MPDADPVDPLVRHLVDDGSTITEIAQQLRISRAEAARRYRTLLYAEGSPALRRANEALRRARSTRLTPGG